MAQAERLPQDGAPSFMGNWDEYHIPCETFEISDPSLKDGAPRRYNSSFWSRWLGMTTRSRRKQRFDTDEEEGDGLLYSADIAEAETLHTKRTRYCSHWCIYGGNTALTIL
jgi:hypothetical protein